MRRLACLVLALCLGAGCISGLDQKPYDVHIGPRIDPDDQAIILLVAVLAGMASAGAYVIADNVR